MERGELCATGDDAGSPDHRRAYDTKLDTLAATITDLAADVLAVQEVLNPVALTDSVRRLPGTRRTALAAPDGRASGSGSSPGPP